MVCLDGQSHRSSKQMPDRMDLTIVTKQLKRNADAIKGLVKVLSDAPQFTPTGWAPQDGSPLLLFHSDTFIQQLGATKSEENITVIVRNKRVKYEGFFSLRNNGNISLRLTFGHED